MVVNRWSVIASVTLVMVVTCDDCWQVLGDVADSEDMAMDYLG